MVRHHSSRRREQLRWLEVWAHIDTDESNSMDYDEFCSYFEFEPSAELSLRTFELFDYECSKKIKFVDFLRAAWEICTFDEDRSKKFWFRVLQKSGQVRHVPSLFSMFPPLSRPVCHSVLRRPV